MKELAVRYAVGAIIFDEEQNFLLLKRNPLRYQGWGFVKGGVDEGENDLQALGREIMEEIGWETRLIELTEHNVLTLIEVAVGGFQDAMLATAKGDDTEIPF